MSNLTFLSSFATSHLARRDRPVTVNGSPSNKTFTVSLLQSTPPTILKRSKARPYVKLQSTVQAGHGVGVMDAQRVDRGGKASKRGAIVDVYVKWAADPKRLELLAHEADLYSNELKPLQGEVVPRCYGFFTDDAENPTMGCLVLEHCSGMFPDDVEEYYRQIMVLGCRLHEVGIDHRQLYLSRHIIACDGAVRIVDFSLAKRHRCTGAHPRVRSAMARNAHDCKELLALERNYGRNSGRFICA